MAKDYSVFDIVGPNMIGPSSSHTAGAARLGKSASKIAGKPVKEVNFLLHGSFAETYKGHGTDKALVGGILGFEPDDARIKHSFELAKEQGVKFEFIKTDLGENVHPNTVKMEMILEDGSKSSVMGASIGGGNIKLTGMDGLSLDFNGSRSAVVLEIKDIPLSIVSKIELANIHAFLSYLRRNYRSKPATISRKNAAIRTFFNYLCNKTKRIPKNPAQDLENPKPEKRLPKYLSLEESKRLLSISQSEEDRNAVRNHAIITLFLNCGMRLSELCNINIKDIDFTENRLTVIGKGNKERTVYLNKACINAIKDYLNVRPKEGIKTDKLNSKKALFLSERRERISRRTVQHIVDKELLAAGLDTKKYSTHKLRHTAATLMYQYGNVDIRALQEVLGHESISTTEIYTHVANEQARDAIENNPLADI